MNSKGLLGKLLILAIVLIIIMGTTIYFNFSRNSIATTIGKVTLDVSYNSTDKPDELIQIEELPEEETENIINISEEIKSNNLSNSTSE